jgi:hypothetical protein
MDIHIRRIKLLGFIDLAARIIKAKFLQKTICRHETLFRSQLGR